MGHGIAFGTDLACGRRIRVVVVLADRTGRAARTRQEWLVSAGRAVAAFSIADQRGGCRLKLELAAPRHRDAGPVKQLSRCRYLVCRTFQARGMGKTLQPVAKESRVADAGPLQRGVSQLRANHVFQRREGCVIAAAVRRRHDHPSMCSDVAVGARELDTTDLERARCQCAQGISIARRFAAID